MKTTKAIQKIKTYRSWIMSPKSDEGNTVVCGRWGSAELGAATQNNRGKDKLQQDREA